MARDLLENVHRPESGDGEQYASACSTDKRGCAPGDPVRGRGSVGSEHRLLQGRRQAGCLRLYASQCAARFSPDLHRAHEPVRSIFTKSWVSRTVPPQLHYWLAGVEYQAKAHSKEAAAADIAEGHVIIRLGSSGRHLREHIVDQLVKMDSMPKRTMSLSYLERRSLRKQLQVVAPIRPDDLSRSPRGCQRGRMSKNNFCKGLHE